MLTETYLLFIAAFFRESSPAVLAITEYRYGRPEVTEKVVRPKRFASVKMNDKLVAPLAIFDFTKKKSTLN